MSSPAAQSQSAWQSQEMQARIQRRYAKERRFRLFGLAAVCLAAGVVVLLVGSIAWRGIPGFFQTQVGLDITFSQDVIGVSPMQAAQETTQNAIIYANYARLIGEAAEARFPDVDTRRDQRLLRRLISSGARTQLRELLLENPDWIGTTQRVWIYMSDDADQYLRGKVDPNVSEADRRLSNAEIAWLNSWQAAGETRTAFHRLFFQRGDSREPELAGIWGAIVGSALTLAVTLALAFPIGVASAIYLEEFAPKNRFTDFVEININNLAAVPSIIFGLLGLAVFLNTFHLPRSAPIVGGLTLSLMTLPTIIIAARAALKAVPPSIRSGAMALGASPMQVVFHHVVPLAMPGILTGTILGMAQALGETAPLLMIGMVAFIVDVPGSVSDAATALPVQIFLWSDSPEQAFEERTSAAILVLLAFLIAMNALAVYLRSKFEKKW